eukprot:TRINITY_DN103153_c0_g1_i1.p1 TRINITY_DN103153_c0_g1~~TRINITY_DN103153_c0_g1_i1.p1  ORF type:complete len:495 (+),score=119.94 TRINITY_DN103153_c0_g1_i1:68-1486(+)
MPRVCLLTVRRGHELLHIHDRELAEAAVLVKQPAAPLVDACAADEAAPMLQTLLLGIPQLATEAACLLGANTVAKGLALRRVQGKPLPSQLTRHIRDLDAAASLMRHPLLAQQWVDQLRSYLAAATLQASPEVSEAASEGSTTEPASSRAEMLDISSEAGFDDVGCSSEASRGAAPHGLNSRTNSTHLKTGAEARRTAAAETRLEADEEARHKAAEEARLKADEEARRKGFKAGEEARFNAEQAARRTAEEASLQAAAEARKSQDSPRPRGKPSAAATEASKDASAVVQAAAEKKAAARVSTVASEAKLSRHGLLQYHVKLDEKRKTKQLVDLLSAMEFSNIVIFVRTEKRALALTALLNESLFPAMALLDRPGASKHEADTGAKIVVTTDVCSRGIAAGSASIVINYDFPQRGDVYLHRLGCGERFAVSFVASEIDKKVFKQVESSVQVSIEFLPEKLDDAAGRFPVVHVK